MKMLAAAFLVIIWSLPAFAAGEKRVLFLDGALVEREFVASKGLVEVLLPAEMLPESFRVKPLGNSTVRWVDIVHASGNGKNTEQVNALEERRDILLDRLKSLDERAEIFRAAAKAQSGRALRKTRNNPDPLGSLRSGTNFALSQLDEISAARRKTRKSLSEIEIRIAALGNRSKTGNVARISLSRSGGAVRVAYLLPGLKWTPWYDFRISGDGNSEFSLCARMPADAQGVSTSVVPLSLVESFGAELKSYPVTAGITCIATFKLPLVKQVVTNGAVSHLSLVFDNTSSLKLPAGEASGYWQGEFVGKASFAGCPPGKSLSLDFGKSPLISR